MPLEYDSMRNQNRDTQPLLSIVVVAYNIDGYIEEALESLLSQPQIDRIRIIVVDDGSKDDTYVAAKAIVERDGGVHIELIRQKRRPQRGTQYRPQGGAHALCRLSRW